MYNKIIKKMNIQHSEKYFIVDKAYFSIEDESNKKLKFVIT